MRGWRLAKRARPWFVTLKSFRLTASHSFQSSTFKCHKPWSCFLSRGSDCQSFRHSEKVSEFRIFTCLWWSRLSHLQISTHWRSNCSFLEAPPWPAAGHLDTAKNVSYMTQWQIVTVWIVVHWWVCATPVLLITTPTVIFFIMMKFLG